jgi:two-component system CheB/CheR fusion protein
LKRHDGEYRWISDSVKPTYSSDGTFAGYIGSCTEVHDKKMYNQELEKKVRQRTKDLQAINMELQRSNGELQQFAYVASHDLQEPLRKIMTFADRIERFKENLPEAGALYLSKIVDSSQRMTRLIDDLLNLSRLSKTDDKFQKVNLNDVLNNVLVDFELAIQQKKAEVVIENLPIINAIGLQMEQLFHNLLSNAFKFSKEDAPCVIKVSCRYLTSSEVAQSTELSNKLKYAEIKVEDNGIGFSEEFAERIFVIFQRLNEKAVYPGTGIGLAICKKIVSNHGGQISASSTEGEGAVFKIILPAE